MILKDLGYLSVSQIDEILQTLEGEAKSKKYSDAIEIKPLG